MILLTGGKKNLALKIAIISIPVFIILFSFSLASKTNFTDIVKKTHSYLKGETREILYLHTNGSVLVPGDTLWVKAYNLRSGSFAPSILGSFLNVSLFDIEGNPIFTGKYKLFHGTANGQIELPDSLNRGNYILTASSNFTFANYKNEVFKKEIQIRKAQNEEVQIKISIPDSVYSEQHTIQGKLDVMGDKNAKLAQVKVQLQLRQGEKILKKETVNTGQEATTNFTIPIPGNLETRAVVLNAQIQQSGLSGNIAINIPIVTIPPIIRFFPEGGNAIDGINTTIAFEAHDVSGNPFDFKGIITGSIGNKITETSTKILGMGSVNIIPKKEEQFFLQILKPKGYKKTYALPKAVNKGYSLQILKNDENELQLDIESTACQIDDSISLLIVLRDKIWFAKSATLEDFNLVSVPISNKPMGVAKVTVFDKTGIPRAERLVFINENKKLKITSRKFKDTYEKKENVNVNSVLQNKKYEPNPGRLSLSVSPVYSDRDIIWSDNIMTSLLLSNELKGDIPAKGYYFSENENSKEALDLLMLTHGWRKFTWEDIQNSQNDGLRKINGLSGKVSLKNGKPVKNGDVTLMNIKTFNAITTKTDNNGRFAFNSTEYINMLNAENLTLTATGKGGSKRVLIELDDFNSNSQLAELASSENIKAIKPLNDRIRNEKENLISDSMNTKTYFSDITKKNFWIEDIDIKANRRAILPQEVYEKQHQSYEKNEDQIHINFGYNEQSGLLQLLHEVAGNFKVVDGGKILFRGSNALYPENMQGAIFVVDDKLVGFTYYDVNHLNSNDIKNIKVTKSSAAGLRYSSFASGGLIEITTKSANTENHKSVPNKMEQNVVLIPGYNLAKEFYSPIYKSDEVNNKNIDLRTTLYWNPNVIIDNSGKANLQFYCSDIPGEYELRIEGISLSGIPFYNVRRFTVK